MDKTTVVMGFNRPITAYPKGRFTGAVRRDGMTIKAKTVSLHCSENDDIAYEIVLLWCQDKAEEYNCKLLKKTKEFLLDQLEKSVSKDGNNYPIKRFNSRQQYIIYQNKLWFNAALDEAIKSSGVDKCIELLEEGLKIAKQYKKEQSIVLAKESEAKKLSAASFLEIFNNTGIQLIDSIDDQEIKDIYYKLLEDS